MNVKAKVTIAIRNFIKSYGKIFLITLGIWFIVFILNQYLIYMPKEIKIVKGHDLNSPIMDDTKKVPKKDQRKIQDIVAEYFNYCNSKEYEKAYDMLSNDCKNYVYLNDIKHFKLYIDSIYRNNKTYYIQNYSNVEDTYVYILGIMDNIEETGTTGGFKHYEERIALIKEGDSFKISCDNYIKNEKIGKKKEDAFIKVDVASKDLSYTREEYNVTITNQTNNNIIIANFDTSKEVELDLGTQYRSAINITNGVFTLRPLETRSMTFVFRKYFDDEKVASTLRFNSVRIMSNNGESLIRNYSFNVEL